MRERYSCGGVHRREFLRAAAAVPILGASAVSAQPPGQAAAPSSPVAALGVPGPYPGRVIEVRNPALKTRHSDRPCGDAGRPSTGDSSQLTGADHPVEAWRIFVKPGEAVGIKVVPNGYPGAHTSPELILEVIDGLRSAGILSRTWSSSTATGASSGRPATRRSCPKASPGAA